jgi:hypothetical protein
LKEEEAKSKSFSLKVQHLITEKEQIKQKMDNMKRKEKIGVPTMQLHSSGPDLKPQGAISSRGEQKSTSRQSEKLPPSGGKNKVEPENSE